MKLKEGVYLHEGNGEYMGVTQGEAAKSFNGLIRNNKTANDIMRLLMTDTTVEAIVAALTEKYDAPKEIIERDVQALILQLKAHGLIDD